MYCHSVVLVITHMNEEGCSICMCDANLIREVMNLRIEAGAVGGTLNECNVISMGCKHFDFYFYSKTNCY